jgi:putative transposase
VQLPAYSNPYSAEAQFKSLKYRPDFPARFGCIEVARTHCQAFFAWYNTMHRHSGIDYMTPHSVHHGHAQAMREDRQGVLGAAVLASPSRFKSRRPRAATLRTAPGSTPRHRRPPPAKTQYPTQ